MPFRRSLLPVLQVLPLIGDGRTRLKPVYVEDVAEAITRMLFDPVTAGTTYEIGGPRVYTLCELFTIALRIVRKRRPLVPLRFAVAEAQPGCSSTCPTPRRQPARLTSSRRTTSRTRARRGLRELGIETKAIEDIVPTYLGRSRVGA